MCMESDRCCQACVSNVDSMGSLGFGPSHADGRTMKLSGYQHGQTRVGACREIEKSGQILSLRQKGILFFFSCNAAPKLCCLYPAVTISRAVFVDKVFSEHLK